MHTIRLTPLEEDTGTRLDSFLSRRVEGLTRSAAARLLAEGCVTCDGAVPGKSYRIAGGEELCVTLPLALVITPLFRAVFRRTHLDD